MSLDVLRKKRVEISEEEYQAACIAILLHDIGHGPFSHALESTLMEGSHHEEVSIALIKELNTAFNGKLSMALEMFLGNYSRPLFNQLISSQVDVDRLDYLKRDSFFSGVYEGNINSERIITMMNVKEENLVFDAKGIYSLEKYLVSRMFMYWQVYYHKTSITAESLLINILKRAQEIYKGGNKLEVSENLGYFIENSNNKITDNSTLEKFVSLDDSDIYTNLKTWMNHPDTILSCLSKAVINRDLPKSTFLPEPFSESKLEVLEKEIEKKYEVETATYFIEQKVIDLRPYLKENGIQLLTKSGEIIPLHLHPEQTLAEQLSNPNKKYHIYYPRDINPFKIL